MSLIGFILLPRGIGCNFHFGGKWKRNSIFLRRIFSHIHQIHLDDKKRVCLSVSISSWFPSSFSRPSHFNDHNLEIYGLKFSVTPAKSVMGNLHDIWKMARVERCGSHCKFIWWWKWKLLHFSPLLLLVKNLLSGEMFHQGWIYYFGV